MSPIFRLFLLLLLLLAIAPAECFYNWEMVHDGSDLNRMTRSSSQQERQFPDWEYLADLPQRIDN